MKRLIWPSLALFALTLIFSACGGQKRAGRHGDPLEAKERVVLLDEGLTYYLNVIKHKAVRTTGGSLKVRLAMENEEDKDVWVDMQVEFQDNDGFRLEETNWEPFLFHRRKVTTFEKVSLNNQATDYVVRIRHAKTAK